MEKLFTVDNFLGLNESVVGATEMKLGEASKIENFYITDDYNLKSRPGIIPFSTTAAPALANKKVEFFWTGYISGKEYVLFAVDSESNEIYAYCPSEERCNSILLGGWKPLYILQHDGNALIVAYYESEDTVMTFCMKEVLANDADDQTRLTILWDYDNNLSQFAYMPYVPLAITEATPSGGGTEMEPLNILTNRFRIAFKSEKDVKTYQMPPIVSNIISIHIGGHEFPLALMGSYDTATGKFTLQNGNFGDQLEVVFVCETDDADLTAAKHKFLAMPYYSYFNGATDNRIFFYGDGTNVSYYTQPPGFGADYGYGDLLIESAKKFQRRDGLHAVPTLYIPAGNELAVDFSDSPITAMVRHYSRLLVYKPDGVDQISYNPLTLADGRVIAGFYLTPVNRNFGNDALGQVVQINNSPRSFTHRSIYEWRVSSGYQDERYAKCISQKVRKTISQADLSKLLAFDDEADKTYYVFLNDGEGTVLVNRYDLDVWSVYRSELTKNVTQCLKLDKRLLFLRDGFVYRFSWDNNFDISGDETEEAIPINCVWESGFMEFGADYKRKYSSNIWISMLPESNSRMEINVETDRRAEDRELSKTVGRSLLDFSCLDFSNFSFLLGSSPKIQRVKMKVKKFVYYKLKFRVTHPGARATVLGYDQQVRYSSNVK